jgi:glycosyltransferase involved in cell wall biosynthesis
MTKFKLAIVSAYPPSKGTLNEYAYHLIQQFKKKGEISELVIITDKLPNGETYIVEDSPIPITIVDNWSFNSWTNNLKILSAARKNKVDIILFNLQFLSFGDSKVAAALGLFTPFLCRLFGIKTVVLLHNIIETVDLSSAGISQNPIMKWIYTAVGTILTRIILLTHLMTVTISKYVVILEKKYGAKNVALVPHGSFEQPTLPDFEQKGAPLQVMTFGKFGTYKTVETMIEATDLVRKKLNLPVEIVIAGTDSPNRKGYLDGVKNQYAHLDNITFTGYVEEEDVPRIFTECTVCVFPYTSTTGSSGVLHQAGSFGKAAILPNIGDLKALVEEEGYTGAFFQPDDLNSLAQAIERTLTDHDYRISIAKKNYAAAASLPMEDIADWYILHFQHLLNPSISGQHSAQV